MFGFKRSKHVFLLFFFFKSFYFLFFLDFFFRTLVTWGHFNNVDVRSVIFWLLRRGGLGHHISFFLINLTVLVYLVANDNSRYQRLIWSLNFDKEKHHLIKRLLIICRKNEYHSIILTDFLNIKFIISFSYNCQVFLSLTLQMHFVCLWSKQIHLDLFCIKWVKSKSFDELCNDVSFPDSWRSNY